MAPTIQAVLARFNGDRGRAMDYVISVARAYPHLATEYWQILDILKGARNAFSVYSYSRLAVIWKPTFPLRRESHS